MNDRVSLNPGRVLVTPENGGEAFYATLTRADNPTQEGDPLNQNTLLKAATASAHGRDDDALPDDMWFDLAPVGSVFWYGKTEAPPCYLICDGSAISRADYARLFAVIGTAFGEGDGSTTFQLPDLRAKFIRGAGSSNDYTAVFGETQEATFINTDGYDGFGNADKAPSYTAPIMGGGSTRTFHSVYVRPYNIALTPIIKY